MNKKKFIASGAFAVIAAVSLTLILATIGSNLFECTLPNDYLFYEIGEVSCLVLIVLLVVASMVMLGLLKINRTTEYIGSCFFKRPKHIKAVIVILSILTLYFCISNTAIVTKDRIIVRTIFCPKGIEYSYADVGKIETGFGEKRFAFRPSDRIGKFSYRIYLDGHRVIFTEPVDNKNIKEYCEDAYYDLEVFDKELLKENRNVKKVSRLENAKYCGLGKRYVDRLIRIGKNKCFT